MCVFTFDVKCYILDFHFKLFSGLISRHIMCTVVFMRLKNSKCKLVKSCFKCCYCPFPMDHVTDGARWMRFLPVTRQAGAQIRVDAPRSSPWEWHAFLVGYMIDLSLIGEVISCNRVAVLRRGDVRKQMLHLKRKTGRASLWVNSFNGP